MNSLKIKEMLALIGNVARDTIVHRSFFQRRVKLPENSSNVLREEQRKKLDQEGVEMPPARCLNPISIALFLPLWIRGDHRRKLVGLFRRNSRIQRARRVIMKVESTFHRGKTFSSSIS